MKERAHTRRGLALLAVALLATVVFGSCGGSEPSGPPRILLVGVDGLEWSVVAPLMRDGELPHLRALMDRGVHGKLDTIDPTMSPVVWTTIATGKLPEDHGIHHFVKVDESSGQPRLYNSRDRRARAFWNILSDREQRVHVVGWFLTYPAEPVRGFMVSQFTSLERVREFWKGTLHEGVPNQTWPETLLEDLAPVIRAVPAAAADLNRRLFAKREDEQIRGMKARIVEHTLWALEADELYGRIALRILRTDPEFDVLAVYFGGPDVVGHRFWRHYRPADFRFPPSPEERERYADVIPEYYRFIDEWIGRLLEAGGEDVTVLVVSDHGMGSINREVDFEELEEVRQMNSGHHHEAGDAPGVIIAAGPGIRQVGIADLSRLRADTVPRLGSVLQITPTLLYLRGLPTARDMAAGPMEPLLDAELLALHPVLEVATFERAEGEDATPELDPELDREMMDRFKALGYIGD